MSARPGVASEDAADVPFARFRERAARLVGRADPPRLVVSPYRFNPLGAHVDHQGGPVLARTLDQYTLLAFWPETEADGPRRTAPGVTLHFDGPVGARDRDGAETLDALESGDAAALDAGDGAADGAANRPLSTAPEEVCRFGLSDGARQGDGDAAGDNRPRYARAAAAVLGAHVEAERGEALHRGLVGVVRGTLISAGLSSSASVVLAYLAALAAVNGLALDARTLVELVRRVENEHLGLANGVQDQMSIVFGRRNALSRLDVDAVEATHLDDPPTVGDVCWLLCYSGVSRDLAAGSGFNTRVAECREAAALLHPGATRLGDVPPARRGEDALASLPAPLGRRARHVFGEIQRVQVGSDAWRHGDWRFFGELMNASCASSIERYESGSEWLIALQEIALGIPGVFGSRFSGGGYGGCLVALVERDAAERVARTLLRRYLERYPDRRGLARAFVVTPERGVRLS